MREYDDGRARRVNGHWQLYVRSRDVGEGGAIGGWVAKTKMTDVPCEASGPPPLKVRTQLRRWRDSIIAEDAVESARDKINSEAELVVDKIADAMGVNPSALSMTFSDLAEKYFDARQSFGGSGFAESEGGSRDICRLWVIPYLPCSETRPIREFEPSDIRRMLSGLSKAGYSASVILKAWTLVKSVFTFAVQQYGLRPNPCYGIRVISRRKPRVNNLSIREADVLARALAGMPCTPPVFAARMALSCGLRGEDIAGLTVADADPESDRIDIRQVVAKRRDGSGKWRYYLCEPKTEESSRLIPINEEVRSVLDARVAALRIECRDGGFSFGRRLYLSGTPDGRWREPKNVSKQWSAISDALGLKGRLGKRVTLHDLRHTFATVFLARGGNIKDLQAILGHSTAMMTLDVYASSDLSSRGDSMALVGRDLTAMRSETGSVPLSSIFEFLDGGGA